MLEELLDSFSEEGGVCWDVLVRWVMRMVGGRVFKKLSKLIDAWGANPDNYMGDNITLFVEVDVELLQSGVTVNVADDQNAEDDSEMSETETCSAPGQI